MRQEVPARPGIGHLVPKALIGICGVAAAYLILAFYTTVASWVYAYIFKALAGTVLSTYPARSGIEGATRKLMPLLFLILVVCDVRALTLPGARAGLAFFKLSVGMGTMITCGSYMGAGQNLPSTAFRVMLADTAVSLLALGFRRR